MNQVNLGAIFISTQLGTNKLQTDNSAQTLITSLGENKSFKSTYNTLQSNKQGQVKTIQSERYQDSSAQSNLGTMQTTQADQKETEAKENASDDKSGKSEAIKVTSSEEVSTKEQTEVIGNFEELEEVKEVLEEIVNVLSTLLNTTPEEVIELLEMNGEVEIDLLVPETLRSQISTLFEGLDDWSETLLMTDQTRESLSTLQNLLTEFDKAIENLHLTIRAEEVMNESALVVEDLFSRTALMPQEASVEAMATLPNNVDNMVINIAGNQLSATVDKGEGVLVEPIIEGVSNLGGEVKELGLTVPIQSFTQLTYKQGWQTEYVSQMTQTTQTEVLEDTLIDQINFKVLEESKEINLQLSPKSLGKMIINIVSENNQLVADIKVETEKAKALILNEIAQLENALVERGINISEVKVEIRQESHQMQMEKEKQKSSKRIQEIMARQEELVDEEERIETIKISDSEVDYMV